MTSEMASKAENLLKEYRNSNVDFRLRKIKNFPIIDGVVLIKIEIR